MSTQDAGKGSSVRVPKTSITIYGGKKEEVRSSIKKTLNLSDDDFYSTWISLGIMKRLGFLFEGGIESAGSITGLILMFAVLIVVLLLFALWEVTIVFIVIAILTLLSGGAAFKFLRAAYITKPLNEIDSTRLEEFIKIQTSQGNFVRLEGIHATKNMSRLARSTSIATLTFRTGIQFSILVAIAFSVLEVTYWFLTGHWLSALSPVTGPMELLLLVCFGVLFICGVIVMDIGVLLQNHIRRNLLQEKGS